MSENKPVLKWTPPATLLNEDGGHSLGYAGPVTGITNTVLVVAGGANFPDSMPWLGGKKKYYAVVHAIDIASGKNIPKKFNLPFALGYSASCSTTDGIVSVGGENENGLIDKALLIRWKSDSLQFELLPALPMAITNASAIAIGQNVFVAGGETKNQASSLFFKLDVGDTAKGWQHLKNIPQAVSHAVLTAGVDGKKIFLAGGRKKTETGISDLYNNLFVYDIVENEWTEKKALPYALSAGTGAMLNDRYLALFGGDRGETFHKTEELISAINTEKDSSKKNVLNEKKKHLQESHPGFSKEILLYDIENDAWQSGGEIPFTVPVTTTAIKMGKTIWIPSGEIRAGVRTPQILKVNVN